MKTKWNVKDPFHPTTILRLISELEGVTYLLDCMGDSDSLSYINDLKKKYYKMYFQEDKRRRTKFAGNYEGPLYAPHPDLENKNRTE